MAEYTKQVWNCGDTITADKMNHIEEGIENASSVAKGGRLIKKVGVADCNSQYDEYDISLTEMQNLVSQGVPMMIETTKYGKSFYKQILNYILSIDHAELVFVDDDDSDLALAKMTLYANNGANEYMDSGRCGLS